MTIPYTVERRADTGVTNVTMGIWLFLASEVMLFGALFSAYALLRVAAPAWPSGRDVLSLPLGAINTVLLALMTAAAWRAARASGAPALRLLAVSSSFALGFLAVKGVEYAGEIAAGFTPSVNTFVAMYYVLTGLHALHVVCGLVANVWILAAARRAGEPMTAGRLRATALYWMFVDVVWFVIFGLIYLS
jgi:heme/copper-type cytochrome/quinol oxidase subunit 3